ncbi:hypothetical protein LMG23992_03243 [Cupriavidus laharis]|uniref:Uncharacterized protein n=1 Tax=Cupriavidus laharis TaxID=151654 RepID=A0ABN7YT00_9BURK|nr:hypothetical protein LMG23992_03243 [Cupriavidus laharis]
MRPCHRIAFRTAPPRMRGRLPHDAPTETRVKKNAPEGAFFVTGWLDYLATTRAISRHLFE